MIYPELVDQDNIRLLRFEDSSCLKDSPEPLHLSLEQFSLLDISDYSTSHADGGRPCETWDVFFREIECRRAALRPHHNS
jgi:hypothetical protein